MHDDHTKELHKNNFGRIAICNSCQEIQLQINTVLFTISQKEYKSFVRLIDTVREDLADSTFEKEAFQKCLLETPKKGVHLYLNYEELLQTIELIDLSNLMLSVRELH